MLNYLWGFMILIGIVYGAWNGTMPEVTQAAINSAKEAVALAITMTGVMAFWMGIMKIAEKSGLISAAVKKMHPVLKFLFPNIPKEHPAGHYIAVNMIANLLGLGWAATPAGLKAMEYMQQLNEKKNRATKEMCTFLIINISSLQLIPMNIVAYRSQYGSVRPTAVIGPGLIATTISTAVAVIFCKVMARKRE